MQNVVFSGDKNYICIDLFCTELHAECRLQWGKNYTCIMLHAECYLSVYLINFALVVE